MMWVLDFTFLAGRYHATPWDRHVNEGAVEWPPSPWRIARALYATYLGRAPELEEEVVRELIHTLATAPPSFKLPRGSVAHTRHYMPLGPIDKSSGLDKTTKVFDTFLALDRAATMTVGWPSVEFSNDQLGALRTLAQRLTYLGRAESWVEVAVRPFDAERDLWNAEPITHVEGPVEGLRERTLVPMAQGKYGAWRDGAMEALKAATLEERAIQAEAKGKKLTKNTLSAKDLMKLEAKIPNTVFDALSEMTTDLRNSGWSQPPGSEWIEYTRPADIFAPTLTRGTRRESHRRPTVLRYAISSSVRPSIDDAISFCDRVRQSLIKHSDGASVFTGRDATDDQLVTNHQHAHFFAECQTGDGRISHFSVYAPMGFDARARSAASRLRRVWGREGHDIDVILVSVADELTIGGDDLHRGHTRIFGTSDVWESLTPFVATRHPKYTKSGQPKRDEVGDIVGSPEHDLRRLLRAQGFPEIVSMERVPYLQFRKRKISWLKFGTQRRGGGIRSSTARPLGFRICFAQPVRGPVCAGYGAHFGLGLMQPALDGG